MNIDLLRNVVIEGQIATILAQIETWKIYDARTNEDSTAVIAQLEKHIAALKLLIKP